VCWIKAKQKWHVTLQWGGKKHHLGFFDDELEAAKQYDTAAREHLGVRAVLNFPPAGSQNSGGRGSSTYRGVSWDKQKNKWRAQVQSAGKVHYIGHFDEELKAAKAYDQAAGKLRGANAVLNFPVSGGE
jgi:hypothetical protein